MPGGKKNQDVLQVVVSKAEAKRIKKYAKRHGVAVSQFLRRIARLVIDAAATI